MTRNNYTHNQILFRSVMFALDGTIYFVIQRLRITQDYYVLSEAENVMAFVAARVTNNE